MKDMTKLFCLDSICLLACLEDLLADESAKDELNVINILTSDLYLEKLSISDGEVAHLRW